MGPFKGAPFFYLCWSLFANKVRAMASGRKTLESRLSNLFGSFFRFSLIGGVATLIHYAILMFLVETGGLGQVFSSSVGFACSSIFNYLANYSWNFRSRKSHRAAYPKFLAIALTGLALNGVILDFGIDVLGFHYLFAQILATGVVLFWNFSGNYFWSFRPSQGG